MTYKIHVTKLTEWKRKYKEKNEKVICSLCVSNERHALKQRLLSVHCTNQYMSKYINHDDSKMKCETSNSKKIYYLHGRYFNYL